MPRLRDSYGPPHALLEWYLGILDFFQKNTEEKSLSLKILLYFQKAIREREMLISCSASPLRKLFVQSRRSTVKLPSAAA